jgi:ribonucleoside-triphosphate reductase
VTNDDINWGPTGQLVYERTYSRTLPDGSKESWPDTVRRVVDSNLRLVEERYQIEGEREALTRLMTEFKILPAGRHLWASGVKNASHLFNCWVSGWTDNPSDHFEFTFMRLMEGGGVGANYSNRLIPDYGPVQQDLLVEIVCDEEHPDYEALRDAGVLSNGYDPDWSGAFVIEDSREGWASALVDLIDTHYREEVDHVRRVYDVSRVREAGRKLRTFGGRASGPLPLAKMLLEVNAILSGIAYEYVGGGDDWTPGRSVLTGMDAMAIDHAIAQCVVAGGVRRSARMSMMHWNDPQIFDFITSKSSGISHWTTNISVEVDSEFWDEVGKIEQVGVPWTTRAGDVFNAMTEGMVRNGEPGFWDSSLSNEGYPGEPNRVDCTNPCGEITLESWEPCNLGHVNLAAFVRDNGKVDTLGLLTAHVLVTRFLIRATFSPVSDPKSREVLDRNRRIGVGHLGVASFLAMAGIKFSEAPQSKKFQGLLSELAEVVERESADFSRQLRIPAPVKTRTVAPTGTISKMPGVSEGIHPIFSRYFLRRVRFSTVDPDQYYQALQLVNQGYDLQEDLYAANTVVVTIPTKDSLLVAVEAIWGAKRANELVEGASDLRIVDHLEMQRLYQSLWADNAVSYTANIQQGYSAESLGKILRTFGGELKGATVFPETSMALAPYEAITKEQYEAFEATSVSDGLDEECKQGACPIR